MGALTIRPGGSPLVLASLVNSAAATQTVYSDADMTLTVTLPVLVSTATTYYTKDGPVVPTLLFPNGTTAFASSVQVRTETGIEVAVPTPTASQVESALAASRGLLRTGYYWTASPEASSTSVALGVGTLNLVPWVVPNAATVIRIGAEIVTAGEAGSLLRLGAYADNGYGYPGARLLDAGTILGDSETVQEITVSQAITGGIIHVGGAVQTVSVTQPTVGTVSAAAGFPSLAIGTAKPGAGATQVGFKQTGVTGALPANFSTTITPTALAPRVFVKIS